MPEIRMNVSSKEERPDNGWGHRSRSNGKKGRNKGKRKRPLCILKRERERVGEMERRRRKWERGREIESPPPSPHYDYEASIYASVHHRLPISTDERSERREEKRKEPERLVVPLFSLSWSAAHPSRPLGRPNPERRAQIPMSRARRVETRGRLAQYHRRHTHIHIRLMICLSVPSPRVPNSAQAPRTAVSDSIPLSLSLYGSH